MKSLTLDTNESPEGIPSRLTISDCLDELAVPERAINFEESLITTPSGVTRKLQMLNGNSKTDMKKCILITNGYSLPNVDVSDPTEETLSDEDYFAVMELSETVINSLNAGGIDIQCSPHIRDLRVISSMIYSHYTKVRWLRKRLYDLLNSGPSTHRLLKDRNNLLHVSSNREGKVTLLHICKEYNEWRLYGYCVINLNEYEVRDV